MQGGDGSSDITTTPGASSTATPPEQIRRSGAASELTSSTSAVSVDSGVEDEAAEDIKRNLLAQLSKEDVGASPTTEPQDDGLTKGLSTVGHAASFSDDTGIGAVCKVML